MKRQAQLPSSSVYAFTRLRAGEHFHFATAFATAALKCCVPIELHTNNETLQKE